MASLSLASDESMLQAHRISGCLSYRKETAVVLERGMNNLQEEDEKEKCLQDPQIFSSLVLRQKAA